MICVESCPKSLLIESLAEQKRGLLDFVNRSEDSRYYRQWGNLEGREVCNKLVFTTLDWARSDTSGCDEQVAKRTGACVKIVQVAVGKFPSMLNF
jgi:hypothetical protein